MPSRKNAKLCFENYYPESARARKTVNDLYSLRFFLLLFSLTLSIPPVFLSYLTCKHRPTRGYNAYRAAYILRVLLYVYNALSFSRLIYLLKTTRIRVHLHSFVKKITVDQLFLFSCFAYNITFQSANLFKSKPRVVCSIARKLELSSENFYLFSVFSSNIIFFFVYSCTEEQIDIYVDIEAMQFCGRAMIIFSVTNYRARRGLTTSATMTITTIIIIPFSLAQKDLIHACLWRCGPISRSVARSCTRVHMHSHTRPT